MLEEECVGEAESTTKGDGSKELRGV